MKCSRKVVVVLGLGSSNTGLFVLFVFTRASRVVQVFDHTAAI